MLHGKSEILLRRRFVGRCRLVLTNEVYFKAGWLHPFDETAAKEGIFHLLDGSEKMVPMMSETENLRYLAGNGYQAVELPMLVILPNT